MDHYSRNDILAQLLMHEKDDSMWQAEFAEPVLIHTFRIEDLFYTSNIILKDCNLTFAKRCGSESVCELLGRSINHYLFGDRVSEVTILNNEQHHPSIIKFRTVHGSDALTDHGYFNTIALIGDDTHIHSLYGRQHDITPQLRRHAERQVLQDKLTEKEFNIFLSLAKGHTVKHIAMKIGSTEKAVYYHIENMQKKMKTQSIIGIVQQAYRLGFMDAG